VNPDRGVAGAAVTPHQLTRPKWQCSSCSEPWPCSLRRTQLLDAYSGQLHELRELMASFLAEALRDVTEFDIEIEAVRRQLVGWLPPRAAGNQVSPSGH
jgi:hypothetical protein